MDEDREASKIKK